MGRKLVSARARAFIRAAWLTCDLNDACSRKDAGLGGRRADRDINKALFVTTTEAGNAEGRARGRDLPLQYNTQRGQISSNGCCPGLVGWCYGRWCLRWWCYLGSLMLTRIYALSVRQSWASNKNDQLADAALIRMLQNGDQADDAVLI